MIKNLLFAAAVCSVQLVTAQNVKTEDVEYRYIKLPLNPLPTTVKNYQSSIFAAYEADNKKKKDEYDAEVKAAEAEYQKEMAAHPARVKAAEDRYNAEMAEWDKKSLAEKVVDKQILKENNKPVKQIVYEPQRRHVPAPYLKTSYDYPVVANTYLILDGFENKPENAVKIEVTMYGFDFTHPRQLTEQKNVVSASSGAGSTTRQVTYYHIEFTYRHTMSVKVTGPDGKELFNLTPQELNAYKTYKSADGTAPVSFNEEQLVKTYEEKILQENLNFINNLVNDKIGFKRELRKTSLSFVKSKDATYTDLMTAYNDASAGMKILADDSETAKSKLLTAVETWNAALKESDLNNKKARIDKEVTTMIYFNLLEAYFALRDVENAEQIVAKLNTMSLSNNDRKQKEGYETAINDLKKRILANQI